MQRWSSALFADQGGGWVERPEPWEQFERETHAVMPPALRERTLMVTVDVNPAVRAALPPRDADRHARMLAGTLQRWRAAGYHSVITGRDFTAADYLDVTHLTPSGGDKLAAAVAPAVRRLASHLGRENQ